MGYVYDCEGYSNSYDCDVSIGIGVAPSTIYGRAQAQVQSRSAHIRVKVHVNHIRVMMWTMCPESMMLGATIRPIVDAVIVRAWPFKVLVCIRGERSGVHHHLGG